MTSTICQSQFSVCGYSHSSVKFFCIIMFGYSAISMKTEPISVGLKNNWRTTDSINGNLLDVPNMHPNEYETIFVDKLSHCCKIEKFSLITPRS